MKKLLIWILFLIAPIAISSVFYFGPDTAVNLTNSITFDSEATFSSDPSGQLYTSGNLGVAGTPEASLDVHGAIIANGQGVDAFNGMLDGSFEDGISAITCTTGTCSQTDETVRFGENALSISLSSEAADVTWTRDMNFGEGSIVTASCHMKTSASSPQFCFYDGSERACADYNVSDSWAKITTSGIAPAAGTPYGWKVKTASDTDDVYVDGCELKAGLDIISGVVTTDYTDKGATTIEATSTNPTKGPTSVDKVWLKRNGDEAIVRIEYIQTSTGSSGSGDYLISLPDGVSFDSDKITFYTTDEAYNSRWDTGTIVGTFTVQYATSANQKLVGVVVPYDSTRFRLFGINQNTSGILDSAVGLGNANFKMAIQLNFPASGWTSTENIIKANVAADIENNFNARIANSGSASVTSEDIDGWVDSVTRTAAGVVSIDYTNLGLTVPPSIQATVDENATGTRAVVTSISTTSAEITIRSNDGTGNADRDFSVSLKKQGADYKNLQDYAVQFPMTRVAYIKDVQPSGTEGQTATTGSFAQMRLNTLEGDTSFVSLSSNRFTLQPGSYTIDATAEAYGTGVAKIALIKDPGGSPSTEIIGSSSYTDNSTVAVTVKLNGKIEIDSATTFELRARAANATRFGVASSFGVDEVYTQVKITRLMD